MATGSGPRAAPSGSRAARSTDYVSLPISEALRVFESFQFTERENLIAGRLLREIADRLRFLDDVGRGLSDAGPQCRDAVGR